MTNACDLLWDYEVRQNTPDEEKQLEDWERKYHRISPHVLVCEAYEESEIKGLHQLTARRLERIRKNQEERLHCLPVPSSSNTGDSLPPLYLDFKKAFSLATQSVYDGMETNEIQRVAVLAGEHRYDLMHRFYSFLGRIGVP